MDKKDFEKLLQEIIKIHNENDDYTYGDSIPEESWIPGEPEHKVKAYISHNNGSIDLTNSSKQNIIDAIYKFMYIKVGNFTVKISSYHANNFTNGICFNIFLFEDKFTTPSGAPCKLTTKLDIIKDDRFTRFHRRDDFNCHIANKISEDVVIDTIIWLKALTKLSAFI